MKFTPWPVWGGGFGRASGSWAAQSDTCTAHNTQCRKTWTHLHVGGVKLEGEFPWADMVDLRGGDMKYDHIASDSSHEGWDMRYHRRHDSFKNKAEAKRMEDSTLCRNPVKVTPRCLPSHQLWSPKCASWSRKALENPAPLQVPQVDTDEEENA